MLIGNLGADPEVKTLESGKVVATFNIATNDSYKDADGNLVERVDWHRVVAWDRLAEIVGEHFKKGSRVYAEGSMHTRSWDDEDGNTRYTTEMKLREFRFLDSPNQKGESETDGDEVDPDESPFG